MSFLLAFYGDDFTGSTDVMEVMTLGGAKAVLFLDPPTPERLAAFPDARAVGVAGVARSLGPDALAAELPPVFMALRAMGADLVHYKVCSTFDSSPEVGSIGRALELARATFPDRVIPLMVGAPPLKRYVAFGNLFATVGGTTYRLDRHPTMSRHPSTPMHEADLLRHLALQTTVPSALPSALVDILTLAKGADAVLERLERLEAEGVEVVLFDTLDDAHLLTLGQVLDGLGGGGRFVAGSSGVEYALVRFLQQQGRLTTPPPLPGPGPADRMIVMSGSAAPATAAQIDDAEARGFELLRIDVPALLGADRACERTRLFDAAMNALKQGRSALLYSARGPDDPALLAGAGPALATAQGALLRELIRASGVRRVCVTGGDTCGYIARTLGVSALELSIPIAPGSPLCLAHADEPDADGLEISLKAGQVGEPGYFTSVLNGHA